MRRLLVPAAGVLAGAGCYALALPPLDCPLFGWLALVPLLLVVRERSCAAAAAWGAFAGFASGWAVTWWLAGAVSSFFAAGLVTGALAMSAAYGAALCTTFGAFGAGAAWLLRRDAGVRSRLAVAALWTSLELLRARLLGQPWALLGYTQHDVVPIVQLAAVAGVAGVSLLVAFGNVTIADAVAGLRRGDGARGVARTLAPALLAVALVAAAGAWTVPAPTAAPARSRLHASVVQSNVPPAFRWTRDYAETQLVQNLRLTDRAVREGRPALLLWPENALGLYLEQEPWVEAALGRVARAAGADLVVGGPRWDAGRVYNSARLVTRSGDVEGHYDKRRLVAFAEAPPLGAVGMQAPSERPDAFAPGTSSGLLLGRVPLAVSICQEALYPEVVGEGVRDGGALLVNLANDGWLDGGHGVGSRQHAAMSAVRAVEFRRWLVRAATTGVSMVVDPWGRVVASLPPGEAGVLHADVAPRADVTAYAVLGDWLAVACPLVVLLAGVRRRPTAARARER